MSSAEDDSDKSHEPSQQKLDEARKKGEIVRSSDLSVAASYAGLLLALSVTGTSSVMQLGSTLKGLIGQADRLVEPFFDGSGGPVVLRLMSEAALGVVAVFALPALCVLGVIVAQRAFVVTPSRIKPKLSRISVISNARNKFGRGGLFEFAKSFSKLAIYSCVLFFFLKSRMEGMVATVETSPAFAMSFLASLCVEFLFVVLLIAVSIGGLDYLWQRHEHLRKNRMSHKELRDQSKEFEGDPHMKQSRRQKAQEIASRRMMQDVPSADVVIVNPTHFAVALKWSRLPGAAPVCVAKGVDEIALRIREIAAEASVPIHSDPPTARALHASTEIGQEISPEHYRAVAAAIQFSEAMREKVRKR